MIGLEGACDSQSGLKPSIMEGARDWMNESRDERMLIAAKIAQHPIRLLIRSTHQRSCLSSLR